MLHVEAGNPSWAAPCTDTGTRQKKCGGLLSTAGQDLWGKQGMKFPLITFVGSWQWGAEEGLSESTARHGLSSMHAWCCREVNVPRFGVQ